MESANGESIDVVFSDSTLMAADEVKKLFLRNSNLSRGITPDDLIASAAAFYERYNLSGMDDAQERSMILSFYGTGFDDCANDPFRFVFLSKSELWGMLSDQEDIDFSLFKQSKYPIIIHVEREGDSIECGISLVDGAVLDNISISGSYANMLCRGAYIFKENDVGPTDYDIIINKYLTEAVTVIQKSMDDENINNRAPYVHVKVYLFKKIADSDYADKFSNQELLLNYLIMQFFKEVVHSDACVDDYNATVEAAIIDAEGDNAKMLSLAKDLWELTKLAKN